MITQKRRNIVLSLVICSIMALSFVAYAKADTAATLTTTTTDTGNVITLNGSGFNASESVYLALLKETDGSVVYNFTESVITDSSGNFAANVTIPTGVYGAYNLTAQTSTIVAYTEYNISLATPTLTVSPDDSNIILVSGTGFNASEVATLKIVDSNNETVYTFPDNITTDNQGNFTSTVIIPTNIKGSYTIIASTSDISANATITVPDLTGPTGATGATGLTGENGTAGEPADSTIGYVAVVLSIVAIAIAALAMMKKR
jgi:hypothetical protein